MHYSKLHTESQKAQRADFKHFKKLCTFCISFTLGTPSCPETSQQFSFRHGMTRIFTDFLKLIRVFPRPSVPEIYHKTNSRLTISHRKAGILLSS